MNNVELCPTNYTVGSYVVRGEAVKENTSINISPAGSQDAKNEAQKTSVLNVHINTAVPYNNEENHVENKALIARETSNYKEILEDALIVGGVGSAVAAYVYRKSIIALLSQSVIPAVTPLLPTVASILVPTVILSSAIIIAKWAYREHAKKEKISKEINGKIDPDHAKRLAKTNSTNQTFSRVTERRASTVHTRPSSPSEKGGHVHMHQEFSQKSKVKDTFPKISDSPFVDKNLEVTNKKSTIERNEDAEKTHSKKRDSLDRNAYLNPLIMEEVAKTLPKPNLEEIGKDEPKKFAKIAIVSSGDTPEIVSKEELKKQLDRLLVEDPTTPWLQEKVNVTVMSPEKSNIITVDPLPIDEVDHSKTSKAAAAKTAKTPTRKRQ